MWLLELKVAHYSLFFPITACATRAPGKLRKISHACKTCASETRKTPRSNLLKKIPYFSEVSQEVTSYQTFYIFRLFSKPPYRVSKIQDNPTFIFLLVLQLSSSLLDPHGPFQMLNALRVLEPQATHNVVVSFSPNAPKEVRELLNVHVFIKYRALY